MSGLTERIVSVLAGSCRARLRCGVSLAFAVGLLMPLASAQAQNVGGRDYDYPAARQGTVRGQSGLREPAPARGMRGQPYQERAAQGRPYPGRPGGMDGNRPGRPRYPGGGGWGPGAAGVGAGIVGGILLDQATRRPVYDPYDPDLPRRPRRPVIVDDYEPEAPALQRPRRPAPVKQAAPPRRAQPPAQTARPNQPPPRVIVPAATERRLVADEILLELAPNAQAETVLRRHRATLIASRRFELAGVTLIRARLNDGRSARTVLTDMLRDRQVASAQPNYIYALQQSETAAAAVGETVPAAPVPVIASPDLPPVVPLVSVAPKREMQPQYVVEKLKFDDIHKLARGNKIKVAVIDSGADQTHPELQGVVAGSFDALGGDTSPDAHGTAMAAAILAQATLQGVAPASRLLAARAFSGHAGLASASGTTFHILSALDWAAGEGARVFNLSFAGPQDQLLSRSLAGARAKGIVAVAAAGNGGAKAAPLYPGADPNVIAVTATDADDKPFAGANQGSYIAVAAPGVDVLAAEPQGRYAFSSGTSIAAAHVSGIVALLLEKRPDLDFAGVRKLLMESAVDLGPKGRDPVFGAGRVDAQAALARALPVSAARP